jgi:hypothetical protein
MPKKLIARFLEFAAMFALGCFLIRLGVRYLLEIWWIVMIVLGVLFVGAIALRMWQNRPKW